MHCKQLKLITLVKQKKHQKTRELYSDLQLSERQCSCFLRDLHLCVKYIVRQPSDLKSFVRDQSFRQKDLHGCSQGHLINVCLYTLARNGLQELVLLIIEK